VAVFLHIRPHRRTILTYMRPIVTDRVAWSVGLSVTIMSPAKTPEPIEMQFGLWTRVGSGKYALGARGAHWHHLINTTEPSVCGGDAAFRQITFSTCFIFSIHTILLHTLLHPAAYNNDLIAKQHRRNFWDSMVLYKLTPIRPFLWLAFTGTFSIG